MTDTAIFPQELRASTAFELFASSSLPRYVRTAIAFSNHPDAVRAFQVKAPSAKELLTLADTLWRKLNDRSERGEEEVDLALLLAAVSRTALEEADELLVTIGMQDKAPLSWISGLARELYTHRSANLILTGRVSRFPRAVAPILTSTGGRPREEAYPGVKVWTKNSPPRVAANLELHVAPSHA